MSEKNAIYQQALAGLRRREGLFRVLIFSFVTVLLWIGFSVYRANTKTKVEIDIQKHTEPLNPNINREVFPELAARVKYTDEELQSFTIYERISDENGVSRLITAGTESSVVPTTEASNTVVDGIDQGIDEPLSEEETDEASQSATIIEEEESPSDATESATQ